jgi:superfamily II DNA or RNA helicase
LDKKGLYVRSATGPVVHELTPGDAAEAKIIAKPTITMMPHLQPPIGGHIQTMRTQGITGSSARNLAILRAVLDLPKPCLVFVRELAHGELLAAMIGRSLPTVFVHGQLNAAEFAAKLKALVGGAASVMVATQVLNQGIDLPTLASTLNAAAGMSAIASLQKIGRGTRIVRDLHGNITKDSVACVDVADRDCGCKGVTHASCAMFLRWTAARRQAYAKAGYLVIE